MFEIAIDELGTGSGKVAFVPLPADEKYMSKLAGTIGEKRLQDAVYLNFQSSIPQIDENILDSMEDIFTLNDIAKKYVELSREDRAKFKAILEFESCKNIEKIGDVLKSLDRYELYSSKDEPSELSRLIDSEASIDALNYLVKNFRDYLILSEHSKTITFCCS